MREVSNYAPGKSATSVALSNAASIRGIQIDNPSGGWLYVVSEKVYVPPYTIGWALPLSYDQSSITINYGDGPAGQIATTQGDNWTLTLFDEAVEQSAGAQYQFTSGFTPQVTSGGKNLLLNLTNSYSSKGQFIGATPAADKRIRVYGSTHGVFSSGASFPPTFVQLYMTNDGGVTTTWIWSTLLTPDKLSDSWEPSVPFDLPVGYALGVSAEQESPYAGGTPTSIGYVSAIIINAARFTVI